MRHFFDFSQNFRSTELHFLSLHLARKGLNLLSNLLSSHGTYSSCLLYLLSSRDIPGRLETFQGRPLDFPGTSLDARTSLEVRGRPRTSLL